MDRSVQSFKNFKHMNTSPYFSISRYLFFVLFNPTRHAHMYLWKWIFQNDEQKLHWISAVLQRSEWIQTHFPFLWSKNNNAPLTVNWSDDEEITSNCNAKECLHGPRWICGSTSTEFICSAASGELAWFLTLWVKVKVGSVEYLSECICSAVIHSK